MAEGFFASLGAGVLNAINGLADWVGVGKDVNRLFGVETTPQEAADLINATIAKARTLSSEKLAQFQARLDNLPIMQNAQLKHIVADARKKLIAEQKKLQAASNIAETQISKAETLANDIPNMKLGDIAVGRVAKAKTEAQEAAQKAIDIINNPDKPVENLIKGVEKYV